MKWRNRLGLACLPVLLSACIAGAALDSAGHRQAAMNLPEIRAPELRIESLSRAAPPALGGHALQGFERNMPVQLQGPAARMDDCWVRYERRDDALQIGVRCAESAAWQLELPLAFGMHDLQVARWTHREKPHWIFSARSRNTTGRSALVVTDEQGRIVWRASLPHAELRKLDITATGLLLTGLDGARRTLSW